MSIYLTRYKIRATQSDHQRARAKEAAENLVAWLWIIFIVALVVGSALIH